MKPDLPKWTRLSTETVFTHPHITLIEDTVVLPSGRHSKWLRWETHDVAIIICLNANNEVLLAYQYNNAPQRVVEEFPGGGIDADEAAAQAAKRELQEEIGLHGGKFEKLGHFLPNNRRTDSLCHVFLATDNTLGTAAPEDCELIETEWVEIAEVDRRIAAGIIEDGHVLAAWALFKAHLGK